MNEGRPSSTARGAAILRAAHQALDSPRVFDDPLALSILDGDARAEIETNPSRFQDRERRHLRAFLVVRSRYAEDELAASFRDGVRQYVILGAGLDTFAYRNPHAGLRVFEVDHPATQQWKRTRLREGAIAIPESVRHVAVDFERESFWDRLVADGLRTDAPAFFSWLGVTVYLTREAVLGTLREIASRAAPGSAIAFSFAVSTSSVAERAAAAGEPWRTFFDPGSLAAELRGAGFARVEHVGPEELNRRYFGGRTDGLRVARTGHLMKASV